MKVVVKTLTKIAAPLAVIAVVVGGTIALPTAVQAQILDGAEAAKGTDVAESSDISGSMVTTVINLMLYVVGIISVVMLIWGGISFAISAGDSAKVTKAKNTIMYSVIGLIVALFAFAIVSAVNSYVTPAPSGGSSDSSESSGSSAPLEPI